MPYIQDDDRKHNFPIFSDIDVVPKRKWHYESNRRI